MEKKKQQMSHDIYLASKSDFKDIQKVQFDCFKKAESTEKLSKKISQKPLPAGKVDNLIYCVKSSGHVGGIVCIRIENETPIISQIAVVTSLRGIGIGSALLKHVESLHADSGAVLAEVSDEFRDEIGFFICNGYHLFRIKSGMALLRKDEKVSEATVSRLKDLLQGRDLGKKKRSDE